AARIIGPACRSLRRVLILEPPADAAALQIRSEYLKAFRPRFRPVRYGPHMRGPLEPSVARTFRGRSYSERLLASDILAYRLYGGTAKQLGHYWSLVRPYGPLQAQLDLAIAPQWGNTLNNVATARIPAGTTIYEGAAASQTTGVGHLPGGGSQIYIRYVDPSWFIPGS
ncbi:hypothetical protein D6779_09095, partial [Candidatus Parcubacteria bacterium]